MGQEGVKLLGAPIGSQAFQKVAMEEKVYKLEKLMDKLSLLEDPHTEYAMLKSCFALPKLSFLLRAVDPRQHQGTLVKFVTAVRQSLERLLGVPLLDHQWLQATLPVSKGGLGIPHVHTPHLSQLQQTSWRRSWASPSTWRCWWMGCPS